MKLELTICPGTLAEGYTSYSPTCKRKLFDSKNVSHFLPYNHDSENEEDLQKFIENRKRISISGVQEKLSLILDKNKLRLTQQGECGTYILKPIPRHVQNAKFVPANEHVTMQIASQVYGIYTAENALIFFENGTPAYITKRFDVNKTGKKLGIEDFASLAGKTIENSGQNFKYDLSYQAMAELLKKYVPAAILELEKFYKIIVFNFLFSNGDAHLKNFSLIETPQGDYVLSPAYDLLNTRLHVEDTSMALSDGLFANDFETESFKVNGYYAYDDFYTFGLTIGLKENRLTKILNDFRLEHQVEVKNMISRSFLSEGLKERYYNSYLDRLKLLNYSLTQKISLK